jgi:hypothetical protein
MASSFHGVRLGSGGVGNLPVFCCPPARRCPSDLLCDRAWLPDQGAPVDPIADRP